MWFIYVYDNQFYCSISAVIYSYHLVHKYLTLVKHYCGKNTTYAYEHCNRKKNKTQNLNYDYMIIL